MASRAVSRAWWSYLNSLSRKSRASGLTRCWFSLWTNRSHRLRECLEDGTDRRDHRDQRYYPQWTSLKSLIADSRSGGDYLSGYLNNTDSLSHDLGSYGWSIVWKDPILALRLSNGIPKVHGGRYCWAVLSRWWFRSRRLSGFSPHMPLLWLLWTGHFHWRFVPEPNLEPAVVFRPKIRRFWN